MCNSTPTAPNTRFVIVSWLPPEETPRFDAYYIFKCIDQIRGKASVSEVPFVNVCYDRDGYIFVCTIISNSFAETRSLASSSELHGFTIIGPFDSWGSLFHRFRIIGPYKRAKLARESNDALVSNDSRASEAYLNKSKIVLLIWYADSVLTDKEIFEIVDHLRGPESPPIPKVTVRMCRSPVADGSMITVVVALVLLDTSGEFFEDTRALADSCPYNLASFYTNGPHPSWASAFKEMSYWDEGVFLNQTISRKDIPYSSTPSRGFPLTRKAPETLAGALLPEKPRAVPETPAVRILMRSVPLFLRNQAEALNESLRKGEEHATDDASWSNLYSDYQLTVDRLLDEYDHADKEFVNLTEQYVQLVEKMRRCEESKHRLLTDISVYSSRQLMLMRGQGTVSDQSNFSTNEQSSEDDDSK